MKKTEMGIWFLLLMLLISCAMAESVQTQYDGNLIIENGILQPMLTFSDYFDPDGNLGNGDILRFCVYVETDNDTDNDGKADLVKVLVQLPRSAAEGVYKAAAIYDPTPYSVGTYEDPSHNSYTSLYVKEPFNYADLYRECDKRTPVGEMTTLEAARAADPGEWIYKVPISDEIGFSSSQVYNYYLVRGYAVVEASGIGTYGSEGFELCGTHLERDSHKAVVEWLAGDRVAYTDKTSNIQIKADWCNGKVAMTGCSYGGTLPFEVATTGVKGLETIIPFAGIASWYDYTNSQGIPTILSVNYADALAALNCGGTFLDRDWTVGNREYGSWLWQISEDQFATNGNYGPIWEESDYAKDWAGIQCSALIVQGLNDFNVNTIHADKMMQAFSKAGKNVKLVLHQDGHNNLDHIMVNGELWQVVMNRWLAHYLYGVDNGAENMPSVLVQSNVDGSWKTYDSWRDFKYIEAPVFYEHTVNAVTSEGLNDIASSFLLEVNPDMNGFEHREQYYMSLDEKHVAIYQIELEENTTIYGVPEIHVRLSNDDVGYEGLMISAVLMDHADDAKEFPAYMTKNRLGNTLPIRVSGKYDAGGGLMTKNIYEYVKDYTYGKAISFGYTDLNDPGNGYEISEYTEGANREKGEFYDYTFYMIPTVYTVEPGHHLYLYLTTWDPYRVYLDRDFVSLNLEKETEVDQFDYAFTADNEAIRVLMPVKQ
ncbi:MAG: hypothetical protein IJ242_10170 [Clostridia bacterium]|nr:hypothetical protein [Clostridia bacterium]